MADAFEDLLTEAGYRLIDSKASGQLLGSSEIAGWF